MVGWAENKVRDSTCVAPQVLQFRAVLWGPRRGQIRELPPLPGDTVSSATALNDRGQVVGISGFCDQAVGRFSAIHAVLWQHGKVIPLGTLGGVAWNTPMSINQRGDVVGFSNISAADGGDFQPARLSGAEWGPHSRPGYAAGRRHQPGIGINERRQVVGTSCDAKGSCRAFLWDNGVMVDLNEAVRPGYADVLTTANDIDDVGRITGQARDDTKGRFLAFVAKPRR